MIKTKCLRCGSEFLTQPCWMRRGRGKFCSKTCKIESIKYPKEMIEKVRALRQQGVHFGRKKDEKNNKNCKECGAVFYCYPSTITKGGGYFCSKTCYSKWKKGRPNGLKGYRHTDDVRKKRSELNKRKGIRPPVQSGPKNKNWRGGVTSQNEKIRKSEQYKAWRMSVYKRDGFRCVLCGYKGNKLQADHIKPFALFPDLRLSVENGRTLCIECHKKTETYGWLFFNKNMKKYKNEVAEQ